MQIFVRFADDSSDLEIENEIFEQLSTVRGLKEWILDQRNCAPSSDHLKLILNGTVLQDQTNLITLTQDKKGKQPLLHRIYFHCIISKNSPYTQTLEPNISADQIPRGFDRLLQMGITANEVDDIRNRFHAIRGTLDSQERLDEEDHWMEQGTSQLFGSHLDLLNGLLFGFFGGLLILFYAGQPGMFSRKQLVGVLLGVLINFVVGTLAYINL